MAVEGKYVRMAEMVRATGHSVETIKKYVNEGRIKTTFIKVWFRGCGRKRFDFWRGNQKKKISDFHQSQNIFCGW